MVRNSMVRSAARGSWLSSEAQRRIAHQRLIVASFEPGTIAHRTATEVLLLLLDCAHVMVEAQETLTAARSASSPR